MAGAGNNGSRLLVDSTGSEPLRSEASIKVNVTWPGAWKFGVLCKELGVRTQIEGEAVQLNSTSLEIFVDVFLLTERIDGEKLMGLFCMVHRY